MVKKPRLIVTLPPMLKRVIEKISAYRGCSQAEVVKTALYQHLKEPIEKENQKVTL